MQKREAAVIFLFIDSLSDFGTYKCKANNSFPNITKYSNGFNFTLAGMNEKRLLLLTNWDHKKFRMLQLYKFLARYFVPAMWCPKYNF